MIIKADGREGMSMYPRMLPGATVLIDRHYNSLKPYRKGESNMYAVHKNGTLTIKYVELAGKHLVLRPHNQTYPVEVMAMEDGKKAHDYLIGRVSYVGSKLRNLRDEKILDRQPGMTKGIFFCSENRTTHLAGNSDAWRTPGFSCVGQSRPKHKTATAPRQSATWDMY